MPTMSDAARKRSLADWVVKFKRQVVKLYAIAKWSRDASVVQKAMVHTFAAVWLGTPVLIQRDRTSRRLLWTKTASLRKQSWA